MAECFLHLLFVEIPFIEGTKLKRGRYCAIVSLKCAVEIPFIEGTKLKPKTRRTKVSVEDCRNPFY